ncbi:hypothetical protein BDB00DRAFT_843828 [Zychaea mexicana]|uniref:uncharacterized protein n=1 Tax=Zychaea mexicana TaxID=64656 RepID=UPI0022FEA2F0|nr:uncharacterized protein BDB00DRAFT_843828 [Zychaea mexicana]KAI9489313.1 hypothetical protein BDB00DRAFT_843828 [Zychaea mexicana]
MFIPTLDYYCNEEQRRFFYERALRNEILGCYAQPELHGSNAHDWNITATYIPETNQFELHSPYDITLSKLRMDSLASTANYAAVMARLVIYEQDFGLHPFCVQIRDLESQRPLSGVAIRMVDPHHQLEYHSSTDKSGFIVFDRHRAPHVSLLAKFFQVKPETGEYVRPFDYQVHYPYDFKLHQERVLNPVVIDQKRHIVERNGAVTVTSHSSTVQQRPVALHEQCYVRIENEAPISDYTARQYRHLSTVASVYALLFTRRRMMGLYQHPYLKTMESPNLSVRVDLDPASSDLSRDGRRRAYHDYNHDVFTDLGHAYQYYLPLLTKFEGENDLHAQNTARYLLETFRAVAAGKAEFNEHDKLTVSYFSQYLRDPRASLPVATRGALLNSEVFLGAFGFRAAYSIARLLEELDKNGRSWSSMRLNISRVSKAHSQYVLVNNFFHTLHHATEIEVSVHQRKALQTLAYLFALHAMDRDMSEFVESGYMTTTQAKLVNEQIFELVGRIRPGDIPGTDAFGLLGYYNRIYADGRTHGASHVRQQTRTEESAEKKETFKQHTVVKNSYQKYMDSFIDPEVVKRPKSDSKL